MASTQSLIEQAAPLVDFVAGCVNNTHDVGNLSSTIYDTAWVSMVRKPGNLDTGLLFPECFQYVLERQLPSGGWESYDAAIDGIINTLGGLLALKKNSYVPFRSIAQRDIDMRVESAARFLQEQLREWDVASTDRVGFEIVIPGMLELLKLEGIHFDFPGRPLLMALNQQKISQIPPSIWSKNLQTSLLHSLEAFVGKVDFSTVRQLLVYGAMGTSPAATAAYLIYSPAWDEDAETYLRNLVISRSSSGFRGVPPIYPTTGFESLWISSTFLEYGFDVESLGGLSSILAITDEFFDSQNGLASGFSKLSVPDADDTARSILVRNLLGQPTSPKNLVERFEDSTYFMTYGMERCASLSTNCNVLSAILESPDPMKYISQIEKCARFLVSAWSSPDIPFTDKWNISEFYPTMLMSEALIRLLKFWDAGVLNPPLDELLLDQIVLVLFQVLFQTLQKQNASGSWGSKPSREITAYAIIALSNLASLPFLADLSAQIQSAIERGRSYIQFDEEAPSLEYIWIAKTTYSPIHVSKAYILAALKTKSPKYILGSSLNKLVNISRTGLCEYMRFYCKLPRLQDVPSWKIQGCILEGFLYLRQLKRIRLDMFGRPTMKKDEYFDFIGITLACANNLQSSFLKTNVVFDMMTLVLRTYQLDEYVEHVIGNLFGNSVLRVKKIIENVFQNERDERRGLVSRANGDGLDRYSEQLSKQNGNRALLDVTLQEEDVSEIYDKLSAFVHSITCHPSTSGASEYDRNLLAYTLQECLTSHITQLDDSRKYLTEAELTKKTCPRGSFYNWVRTTGASHLCGPLALVFLCCLVGEDRHRSRSAEEQFLIQDLWTHLSTKGRMENDRASFRRDRKEKNLNCLDFPEFAHQGSTGPEPSSQDQLTAILAYERRCCELAFAALQEASGGGGKGTELEALRFFYFFGDLYDDVYMVRDISNEK